MTELVATSCPPRRRGSYAPLDLDSVVTFVRPWYPDAHSSREIGSGNVNLVFRVLCGDRNTIVVKQALPYLRVVGDSWPLSLDRARIEAGALKLAARYAPGLAPRLLNYDRDMAALVMEDLKDLAVWRSELMAARHHPTASSAVAKFCAWMLHGTSDFGMGPNERKRLTREFINPDMCAITESLVFTDPFGDSSSNNIEPELRDEAERLWRDRVLQEGVAELRFKFRTTAEALIHADLHTGSVMVGASDTRVIDPEFSFMGPIAYDIGVLLGNLAISHIAHHVTGNDEFACLLWESAEDFWSTFADALSSRWPAHEACWREAFLNKVLGDAARYAGLKLIRRTIGLAHAPDVEEIDNARQRLRAQLACLDGGRALVVAPRVASLQHLWGIATETSR